MTENTCLNGINHKELTPIDIYVEEPIELKRYRILFPPMPCCAQLAAPFWAKFIGTMINKGECEYLVEIAITLYDEHKNVLKECVEEMFLDNDREGEFDIHIPHLTPSPSMYSIKVHIKEEV